MIDNVSVLSSGFYKYDKTFKTYDTYSKATGSWKKNGGSSLSAVVLNPSDAFWVYPNIGVTSVAFNLGQTVQTKTTGVDKTNKLEMDSVKYTSLGIMMNSKKDSTLRDFSMLVTRSGTFDLTKNPNDLANMSSNCIDASFVLNNGVDLMTVKCVSNKKSFVIPMFVKSCSFGSYAFHFNIDYNSSEISQFDLIDRYNNKITKIENGRDYSFEINSDSNSFGFNRFFINFSLEQLGSERLDNTQVSIYPNPISTRGVLSLYNPLINKGEKVSLIDLNGRILHCQGGKDGLFEMDLRTIGVTPGVYFVKYEINSVPFYSKLVVNNL
jgi:hypothetical protein